MRDRSPLAMTGLAIVVVLVVLGGGTALGVGPLAATQPPDQVTDPKEMVARSLQATIDATSVRLAGTIEGTLPGALVDRPEPSVDLDGSTLEGAIRPKDAKTSAHLVSPGLEIDAWAVTVWDGAWYRTAADEPWERVSLGGASAEAGVDINPLTLVDRLRNFLATPGLAPSLEEVTCASASRRCHRVTVTAGRDPGLILKAMLPAARRDAMPDVRTTVTLDTDALTLRPAHLVVDAASDDGAVTIHLELDASDWDGADIVIEEPAASS